MSILLLFGGGGGAGPVAPPSPRADIVALVAHPYDRNITVDLLDWPLPTGDVGLPVENQFSLLGGETAVYVADQGFVTEPAHTPADTWMGPFLAEPFLFGVRAFRGTEPDGTQGESGLGQIALTDPGGDLDAWLNYNWDGRSLSLRRGSPDDDFATWETIANLTCDGMTHDLAGKTFRLRDLQYRLYASTFLQYRYAGTGGLEGDAARIGQAKPIALGRFFNAEPVLIVAGTLIYQIHIRQMEAITAVRDGGSALTFSADYGSYTALAAATVSAGHYATSLADGLLRCGSAPTFGLRVDGKGDKRNGVYVETRGGIARRIATSIGDLLLGDPDNIDTASFTAMDVSQPAPVGLFLMGESLSVGQVLDKFMAGCAGWWTISLTGQMRVQLLEEPDDTADIVLAKTPDLAGTPVAMEAPPPRFETSIGFQRNWSPQDPANLAGAVGASDRKLYQDPWSLSDPIQGRDDTIPVQHLAARRVFVEGFYALKADADAEAHRQRSLFSVGRRTWRVRVWLDPFTDVLGRTVEITGMNRLGWGVSIKFRCIGLVEASASAESMVLILWEDGNTVVPPVLPSGESLSLDFSDPLNSQYLALLEDI